MTTRKKTAAEPSGDVFSFKFRDDTLTLRPYETDGFMDAQLRTHSGHPFQWWIQQCNDPVNVGADTIAVLVWSARYQAGEHALDVSDVLRDVTYRDATNFELVEDVDEGEAEGGR